MNFFVNSPVVAGTLLLLVLLSVVSWSISLLKLLRQLQDKKRNAVFNAAFWNVSEWSLAEEVALGGTGDMARLARSGFTELNELRSSDQNEMSLVVSKELLEQQLKRQVQNIRQHHEHGLAELATIGSTAPFVGLFGTVWGIMHALQNIGESGSVSLDVVAGPIGEALITTAIGIATALPAVLAYNYFLRHLRLRVGELDNFAHDFMRFALRKRLCSN
jgi:biopolymer transport protein ExbB